MNLSRPSALLVALITGATIAPPLPAFDGGAELRRFQDETRRRIEADRMASNAVADAPATAPEAARAAGDVQTTVLGFEVHGVTRFTNDEVAGVLDDFVGRSLGTVDLHAAADALMRRYRSAGYVLAKVYVPPQAFTEIVRLDVEECRIETGCIERVDLADRVDAGAVTGLLDRYLYTDRPLERRDLERVLLLADDLPGVRAGSILYPGTEVGTARLRVLASDEPTLAGNVDLDNFGYRPLGRERLGTTLYLNSPGGVGDQVVARLVTSGGSSNYAYVMYLRPVGRSGARMGGSVDHFSYDGEALFDGGDIDGEARDARLFVTYPLVRSRHSNLTLRTDWSHYRIIDRSHASTAPTRSLPVPSVRAERRLRVLQFSLSGDDNHDALPNGTTLFDVNVVTGDLDIAGDAGYARADALGANTRGRFSRASYRLQRLQHLSGPWSIYASLYGQFASRNLDASQRFYLGGATSQPGYPIGETSGDSGMETHVELRRDLSLPSGDSLQIGAFYSHGEVEHFKSPWQRIDKTTSLGSVGLQLTYTSKHRWLIRGLIGRQTGGRSPIEQFIDLNSDGKDEDYRMWFQAIRYFELGGSR